MLQAPPAQPGMREDEIDTPALLIDLDAFEYNLDRMAALLAPTGVKLRAHAKTHKSPVIAKLQMARGAVGQCVQKVAEAEVLAWGGIPDILVSNEVVGAAKLARLCALARIAKVAVCADDAAQVAAMETAAADAGIRLPVLVEIDVGAGAVRRRTGPDAVALAQRIAASKHLMFGGLAGLSRQRAAQAHGGGAAHADRRARWTRRAARWSNCASRGWIARSSAVPAPERSRLKSASGVYTEMQAGSYVFMDADYARNLDADGAPIGTFRHALFVLATVMSAPQTGWRCWTPGHKAVAVDSGLPVVWQRPDIRYVSASDEHGKLEVAVGNDDAEAGREAAAGARALRSDGGSLRLVCRRARRPGRVPVAGGGARRDELTRLSTKPGDGRA